MCSGNPGNPYVRFLNMRKTNFRPYFFQNAQFCYDFDKLCSISYLFGIFSSNMYQEWYLPKEVTHQDRKYANREPYNIYFAYIEQSGYRNKIVPDTIYVVIYSWVLL